MTRAALTCAVGSNAPTSMSSEKKGDSQTKSHEVEGARAQLCWGWWWWRGAELPGQTPRIEGAILGGKAQERIPGLAREPGHR